MDWEASCDEFGDILRRLVAKLKKIPFRAKIKHMESASLNEVIIQFAVERMENREKSKRQPFVCDFKPEDFKDFVKNEEELKARLGRKWKENLKELGIFAIKHQPITSNYLKKDKNGNPHPVHILPIACTSPYLLDIFKKPNPRYASRLIDKCKKIGLLVEVKHSYRFGFLKANKNECKAYAYNKEVEHLIIRICKKEGIKIQKESIINNPLVDRFKDSSLLSKEEQDNISLRNGNFNLKNYNIDDVKAIIQEKYSALIRPRVEKIAEMNRKLPSEQQIRFRPNPKYGKKSLRRISIRATSPIVSSKVEKDEKAQYRIYRDDYLTEYFDGKPYFQYDVHGSIFQVAHLLNYGEWLDGNGIDPYEVMFGQAFGCKTDRSAYKLLAMSLYFDDVNMIYAHSRLDTLITNLKYGKRRIKEAIAKAAEKMERFAGKTLYNEIFLHESLIYIDFVYELRNRGINVIQIYDGFYFCQGSIGLAELERLMRQCAMHYLDEYMVWLKDSAWVNAYNKAA